MDGMTELTPLHAYLPFPGSLDTAREHFKRAVLRPPPRFFCIEFLPVSYKGSYNHGMRISPLQDSPGNRSRNWDYEIWRQWEDILWFQQALETEYARAAREKKVRLAQGKGVKSLNGIYKQDMASSWESLPPGPLPSSVAQDIHKHLPRLTKKGTVFRASHATVDQRQKELCSLVEALFSDDMPALILELRTTHHVTDFFGLWRRDYERMEKSPIPVRNSVTSSVFSTYFSESSPSLAPSANSKSSSRSPSTRRSSASRPRSSGGSSTSSTIRSYGRVSSDNLSSRASIKSNATTIKRLSGSSDEGVSVTEVTRPRALSNTSSDSSSTHSDGYSENGSTVGATPTIVEDSPITFDHNPHVPLERCSSVLEVLPEEREMLAKSPETYFESTHKPKSIASPMGRKTNRSWQVVSTSTTETTLGEGKHIVRESYQSHASIDSNAEAFLDGLNLSLPSIKEQDYRASVCTILTTNSADAVFPRESSPAGDESSQFGRVSNTVSLSEFEIYPASVEKENSTQDLVLFPRLPSPIDRPQQLPRLSLDFPTTPTSPTRGTIHEDSSFECLPSPTASNVPTSPSTPSPVGSLLSIKAAHNSSIIMLRVPRDTTFEEVRQRLYNKFVGQEGVPLSKEFAVAMVVPSITAPSPAKSSSSKLSRSLSVSSTDKMELHFIDSHYDWEQVVLINESNKVTLRILDAPRV